MASYSRLNPEDITVSTDKVAANAWTDDTDTLTTFFTSSTQAVYTEATSQGNFFVDIYKDDVNLTSSAPIQFSVAYGHKAGSGSLAFTNTGDALGNSATKVIYNQYRQLVYGDENSNFTFNGGSSNDIWVINVARGRYKHALKAGSLNITLSDGANVTHLTDDSVTTTGSARLTNLGRQFNLVSGSSGTMVGTTLAQTTAGSYGFVYPDAGIIILNPSALAAKLSSSAANVNGLTTSNTDTAGALNPQKFLTALNHISASSFVVDAEEKVSSQFYFTRVTNQEFNYSTNPTFTNTNGVLKFNSMTNNPKVYITTVGLYNDANELLAVAKLSQPLPKDFTKEALVRIKLDY